MSMVYMNDLYRSLYPNTQYRANLKRAYEKALKDYEGDRSNSNYQQLVKVAREIEEEIETWC